MNLRGLASFVRVLTIGGVDQTASGILGLAVAGTLPQLGALVLEPDLDLTGGPVQLLGNLGTNFKRGKGVDGEGTTEDSNFFASGSLSLLVEVLDTSLNSQINLVGRGTASRLGLDTPQSLRGLEGFLGKVTLDGSTMTEGKKPLDSLKKFKVVVLVVLEELVANGVLEINNRHDECF